MCYGSWEEEQQKKYFKKFIEADREGAFIITFKGRDIRKLEFDGVHYGLL